MGLGGGCAWAEDLVHGQGEEARGYLSSGCGEGAGLGEGGGVGEFDEEGRVEGEECGVDGRGARGYKVSGAQGGVELGGVERMEGLGG